jgi:hypothetical protein
MVCPFAKQGLCPVESGAVWKYSLGINEEGANENIM